MQSLLKIGILLAVVTLLVACNPLREISNIRVTVTSETDVPGDPTSGLLKFAGFDSFKMSEQQTFKNSDATRDNLESSSLRAFTLRVLGPEQQDLAFIQEMEIFIDADGEEKRKISFYSEFEEDDREVTFHIVDSVDLTPYFIAEEAKITVVTEAGAPDNDTELQIEMVFNINFLI